MGRKRLSSCTTASLRVLCQTDYVCDKVKLKCLMRVNISKQMKPERRCLQLTHRVSVLSVLWDVNLFSLKETG